MVTMLGTFTVLCITLPISQRKTVHWEKVFSGFIESLDLTIKLSRKEELHLETVTTGSCPELKEDVEKYGKDIL